MIRKSMFVAAGLIALWVAPASASLVCTTTTPGTSGTCSESSATSSPLSISALNAATLGLDLFNSNLGTLTSVNITINGYEFLSGTLSNPNAGSVQGTGNGSILFSFNDGTADPLNTALSSVLFSTNAVSDVLTVGSLQTLPLTGAGLNATNSGSMTGPLTTFETAGGALRTINIGANSSVGSNSFGNAGSLTSVVTNQGGASISVTYGYTIPGVPEPLSAALLGSGLVAVGLIRRKTR